jgi:hypothetical protein
MSDTIISLALSNFFNPVILFFILGFGARLLKSDLTIPGNVSKFIAIYLMMAIGYKGGYALSQSELNVTIGIVLLTGGGFSFLLPFMGYAILGAISNTRPTERAAIVAHYGSVSVVTFVTATELLNSLDMTYDSWMVAVMAAMETPAIFAGLLLVNKFAQDQKNHVKMDNTIWREIFLNGSVVILVGAFFIGWIAGEPGMKSVEPFFVTIFKGVLCLFMVDIGMVAASKLGKNENGVKDEGSGLSLPLVAFGIVMPLISAALGGVAGAIIGLSVGSLMLFCVLCASASYIAVPAALRIALPHANLSPSIALSLAVTFPFNIIFGLPLYLTMAEQLTRMF